MSAAPLAEPSPILTVAMAREIAERSAEPPDEEDIEHARTAIVCAIQEWNHGDDPRETLARALRALESPAYLMAYVGALLSPPTEDVCGDLTKLECEIGVSRQDSHDDLQSRQVGGA
ncbi:MAG: hypothetical protein OYL92_03640 [Acidobacteriota bacterium]|nr:hypothetical protein [Acidobacteriota bacterium]MDE3264042.1 hypothetical protein [Acidobacteriota bacterium]